MITDASWSKKKTLAVKRKQETRDDAAQGTKKGPAAYYGTPTDTGHVCTYGKSMGTSSASILY